MKRFFLCFTLTVFFFSLSLADEPKDKKSGEKKSGAADNAEIQWLSYDDGVKLAKEKKLHMLINFTTSWCGWCKRMNKTTFKEPEVIKMMTENFVNIKVNGEGKTELNIEGYKITERRLATAEFGVRSYPTYWFLKPDGEKVGPLPGYQQAPTFLDVLFFIKESLYDKMTFEEYLKAGGRNAHKG